MNLLYSHKVWKANANQVGAIVDMKHAIDATEIWSGNRGHISRVPDFKTTTHVKQVGDFDTADRRRSDHNAAEVRATCCKFRYLARC